MNEQTLLRQDEKVLAAVAHGSILLGPMTNGIGGIVTALVIWLVQKDRSAYVAFQALQALAYQGVTFVLTGLLWCCWGVGWMALWMTPTLLNPAAYQDVAPPAGFWIGLALAIVPLGLWGLTFLYALYAAARCLGGHAFKYAVVGRWLEGK